MGTEPAEATVLVVDDERMVADAFSALLERWYTVRAAYGGEEALALVEEDVDVVLLDRRMPDRTGDEVLRELREREIDVQVVMVTAVNADFDILSIPCDGYLEKPIDGNDLREAVEKQVAARDYDRRVAEFFATTDKLAALEADRSEETLEANDEYVRLKVRQLELREEIDALVDAVGEDDRIPL